MHKQIAHLVRGVRETESNRLMENMSGAEVRRNTAQFLGILALLGIAIIVIQMMGQDALSVAGISLNLAWAGLYLTAAVLVYFVNLRKVWCVRLSLIIIFAEVVIASVRSTLYQSPSPGDGTVIGVLIGLMMGAALLPWTPRQTLALSAIWIVASTASVLMGENSENFSVAGAIFAYVAVTIPGIMISFFRMSRFQDKFELHFIQSQYDLFREELQAAKNIHERGFPKPKSSGEVRFTYAYRPMSQIGGDSIFASIERPGDPESPVTIVLFDVTGHGISAALTANRLQGELMRITGEEPSIDPGELLIKMDRYVCLTLADSAVLVSAVAIVADPRRSLIRVANAGHPSPLLRTERGALVRFDSSAPVLGVGIDQPFAPAVEEQPFRANDSLIAYTDGVSEALLGDDEMYKTTGVERVLEQNWVDQSTRWPALILEDVENRRAGPASDDILIVELYRD
ncbi:MAG: SpoIIE family protein phosphatase [Phycisphaerales bacterium]